MPADRRLPAEMVEHIAELFRALADPSRLAILRALLGGPKSVSAIVAAAGVQQANTSKHLAVLAAAGIVSRTREGTSVIYAIADPMIYKLCDLVCGAVRGRIARQLKTHQRLLRKT